MRLRLTSTDLRELAALYRLAAAEDRKRAEGIARSTQVHLFIEAAQQKAARARKLDDLAARAEDFILAPAAPFNGGPPSLMLVGGSDAADGSAFLPKRKRHRS
jgi:hypothetical protein